MRTITELDSKTKINLTILTRPLNASADVDAMAAYVERLWSDGADPKDLEALAERTSCIEQIARFAGLVPQADVQHLMGVIAMIEVMEA